MEQALASPIMKEKMNIAVALLMKAAMEEKMFAESKCALLMMTSPTKTVGLVSLKS